MVTWLDDIIGLSPSYETVILSMERVVAGGAKDPVAVAQAFYRRHCLTIGTP